MNIQKSVENKTAADKGGTRDERVSLTTVSADRKTESHRLTLFTQQLIAIICASVTRLKKKKKLLPHLN